ASIQRLSEQLDAAEVRRIGDILYRQAFNGNQIRMAVPPSKMLTSILELPPRTANSPFDQLARAEFARHQKCDADALEMAWWELPQASRVAKTTSVMAIGCRYTDADLLLAPFEDVGLDVLTLDSGSCAAARACSNVMGGQSGISAILDLGWRSASLVILHDQTIIYDRPLGEAGIEQLYKDLSKSLGIKYDVIDVLISQAASPTAVAESGTEARREIAQAVESHFSTLLKDLELSFSYAVNQYASSAVNRLLLIGGGASIPGLADNWTQQLGIKVQVVHPADIVAYAEGVFSKDQSAMTTAVGLAMGGPQ
ncbi:MAG TPA: pilus assembly protein PilM, partial [Tepidisphaeraceae bacterium]|nr:pilus assembly protein PilM [Tepidisphaeraceae bacterium]